MVTPLAVSQTEAGDGDGLGHQDVVDTDDRWNDGESPRPGHLPAPSGGHGTVAEVLVEDVIDTLRRLGPVEVSELTGRKETIEFRLPPELTGGTAAGQRATAKV